MKTNTVEDFKREANAYSKSIYGSTLIELMIDESELENAFNNGETPKQYVDWLGDKYSFTKVVDFSFQKARAIWSGFKS